MARLALRSVLMEEAVSVIITGRKNAAQAPSNGVARGLAALSDEVMRLGGEAYRRHTAPHLYRRWQRGGNGWGSGWTGSAVAHRFEPGQKASPGKVDSPLAVYCGLAEATPGDGLPLRIFGT